MCVLRVRLRAQVWNCMLRNLLNCHKQDGDIPGAQAIVSLLESEPKRANGAGRTTYKYPMPYPSQPVGSGTAAAQQRVARRHRACWGGRRLR